MHRGSGMVRSIKPQVGDSMQASIQLVSGRYWSSWPELLPILGAWIPRIGQQSMLHHLPKDVLQHIAQLAYGRRSRPRFQVTEEQGPGHSGSYTPSVQTWTESYM